MEIRQTTKPESAYFYSELYKQIENMEEAVEIKCNQYECNSIRVLLIRRYGKGVYATQYNGNTLTIWKNER